MRPITAGDLMNPEILTVREDMVVNDLAAFLTDNEITGAPVEDAEGKLVGVVSVVDIAAEGSGENLLVGDIMTPEVRSVTEDAPVPEVATVMLENHMHRVLVTRDNLPVGIVSTTDLLGLLVEEN